MKIIPPDFENYRRADGKFYIVYRVDVLNTDRFYIGSRCCDNINDTYYGSPNKHSDYYNILTEAKSNSYKNLIFTILKWTTKQKRYIHEEEFLHSYKTNINILNLNFNPTNTFFAYEKGDQNNPFIKQREKISEINRQKNKSWAGIYHFHHPQYGEFKCSITELIEHFKKKYNIIIDRGMMNLISRYGHVRDGWPVDYKKNKTPLRSDNKYYNWTCLQILKEPFLRSKC